MAILGGTFDPIHFGHLRTGLEIYQNLDLAEIRFIPCRQPVHKPGPVTDAKHRLKMVKLAIAEQDGFVVDEREIKRESASFMVPTLESLRQDYPTASISLILGADALGGLHRWYRWQELLNLCHIIAVQRPGYNADFPDAVDQVISQSLIEDKQDLRDKTHGCILFQSTSYLAISGTEIRHLLHQGKSVRFLLPDPVIDYIKVHNLY